MCICTTAQLSFSVSSGSHLPCRCKVKPERKKVKVTQLCPTLCHPKDYRVHGILQARILEWVAFPFSRGSSWPRSWTWVSCIADIFFTKWAIREAYIGFNFTYCASSFYFFHIILSVAELYHLLSFGWWISPLSVWCSSSSVVSNCLWCYGR